MRSLIRLLVLGAGAAYLYKRFVADPKVGATETAAAEAYSSDQLDDPPGAPPHADEEQKDTLEKPTWLNPADAG